MHQTPALPDFSEIGLRRVAQDNQRRAQFGSDEISHLHTANFPTSFDERNRFDAAGKGCRKTPCTQRDIAEFGVT
jgi:hypothetical protein